MNLTFPNSIVLALATVAGAHAADSKAFALRGSAGERSDASHDQSRLLSVLQEMPPVIRGLVGDNNVGDDKVCDDGLRKGERAMRNKWKREGGDCDDAWKVDDMSRSVKMKYPSSGSNEREATRNSCARRGVDGEVERIKEACFEDDPGQCLGLGQAAADQIVLFDVCGQFSLMVSHGNYEESCRDVSYTICKGQIASSIDKYCPDKMASTTSSLGTIMEKCPGKVDSLIGRSVKDDNDSSESKRPYPTIDPSEMPSEHPTTKEPTKSPSSSPTTDDPTIAPSEMPSEHPTTKEPTKSPSPSPTTDDPTIAPSQMPSEHPTTKEPTKSPSSSPTTDDPTIAPSGMPSDHPTTKAPTKSPSSTDDPTITPSEMPSEHPTTKEPTKTPSSSPTTEYPTLAPSNNPSLARSAVPSEMKSAEPSLVRSERPSAARSEVPSEHPTTKAPTMSPSSSPMTDDPTLAPSDRPSVMQVRKDSRDVSSEDSSGDSSNSSEDSSNDDDCSDDYVGEDDVGEDNYNGSSDCDTGLRMGGRSMRKKWEREGDDCDNAWNVNAMSGCVKGNYPSSGRNWRETTRNRCAQWGIDGEVERIKKACFEDDPGQCLGLGQAAADQIVLFDVCGQYSLVGSTDNYEKKCRETAYMICEGQIASSIDKYCPDKMPSTIELVTKKCPNKVDALIGLEPV